MHAAVDGEAVSRRLDDEARTGDRPRRSHELDFHFGDPLDEVKNASAFLGVFEKRDAAASGSGNGSADRQRHAP